MRPFFHSFLERHETKIGHTHIIQHPVKLMKAFQVVTGHQIITRNKARKSQFNEKEVNFCRFFLILKPVAPKRMVISFFQEKKLIFTVPKEAFPLKRLLYDAVFFREKNQPLFTQNSKTNSEASTKNFLLSVKKEGAN
jgi:hypothetical protein